MPRSNFCENCHRKYWEKVCLKTNKQKKNKKNHNGGRNVGVLKFSPQGPMVTQPTSGDVVDSNLFTKNDVHLLDGFWDNPPHGRSTECRTTASWHFLCWHSQAEPLNWQLNVLLPRSSIFVSFVLICFRMTSWVKVERICECTVTEAILQVHVTAHAHNDYAFCTKSGKRIQRLNWFA